MKNDIKAFKFIYAKDYVSFLINQYLEETYQAFLDLLEKSYYDAGLKKEKHYFIDFNQSSLKHILTLIKDDSDFHHVAHQLSFETISEHSNNTIKYNYRRIRQLLIKLLSTYTSDYYLYTNIINEIEEYFIILERYSDYDLINRKSNGLLLHNEFLYSIINNSIDGVAAFDKDLRVIEWNKVLEKHHSITKENIIGRKIFEALPEYSDSEEIKASARVFKGEKVFLVNQTYKTKEYGWYDAYMAPLYNENKVEAIFCIFRDITKRKENEDLSREQRRKLEIANKELKEQRKEIEKSNEELQESFLKLIATQDALKENEARLNEAQAVAHLGSWEYDLEQNNIFWSDELKRIFGYAPGDNAFNYETYLSLIHPDDQEIINFHVNNTLKTYKPYSFEHRIIKKEGETRWIQAIGKAVIAENKVVKLKGTALDITERKIAEDKLREEQHFIQKIADTTPNVITVFDLKSNKNIYFNKELYELLGYFKEELEQIRFDKDYLKLLIHPEDLPRLIVYLENFKKYSGNDPKEIEYRIKDKRGNYKWITSRHNVFKTSDNGDPLQIIGISREITEKKEAEIQLLERESKLKESQQLAKMGHWELDLQTKSVHWSDGLYDIYGIEYGTHLNLEIVKAHIISKDYKELIETIENSAKIKKSYSIEYRIKHPVNGIKTLFSRGTPILNEENDVVKFKGITQDITDRKNIEQELKESQNFIKAITESVPNIIFVYDVINDKGLYANRELALTLGYSNEDIKALGKNLMKTLVHKDDYKALMARNKRVKTSKGDEIFEVFFQIKHANGEWRWLRSLSRIFRYNSEGLPWQILGVTEDVTDRKLAEDKLQKTYTELQSKNRELAYAEELLKKANNELELRVEKRTKELSDIIIQLKRTTSEQKKFTALVEKSINFISMADVDGNIIYLNEGGMKLVGITSKEEALRTKIKDYF